MAYSATDRLTFGGMWILTLLIMISLSLKCLLMASIPCFATQWWILERIVLDTEDCTSTGQIGNGWWECCDFVILKIQPSQMFEFVSKVIGKDGHAAIIGMKYLQLWKVGYDGLENCVRYFTMFVRTETLALIGWGWRRHWMFAIEKICFLLEYSKINFIFILH